MIPALRIRRACWDEMLRHASEAVPEECCGLLLGRAGEVVEIARARNAAAEPRTRFLVDPADHFRVLRRARASGWEILGAYHSHPAGAPRPSETDRLEATGDPDFVHVIISPGEGTAKAYNLADTSFVPLAVELT